MSYAISDIITWAKASQALAYMGEKKKLALQHGTIEEDLHIKLYLERKSLEYSYAQDPTSDQTYQIGQWVLALCGEYLFPAQVATGGGGSISPVVPGGLPLPIEFEVTSSSYITSGSTSKVITDFIGFNLIFIRNHITQSTINQGDTYHSWNRTTGTLNLFGPAPANGAAQLSELFQLYPTA